MRKITVILLLVMMSSLMWAQDTIQPIRVGLLLPLQTDALKRDKNMDRFVEFYTGALIAVYEIQQKGQAVEIHTYDVGRTTHGLQQLLDSSELAQMDMIIGPAYSLQVHVVADWALEHETRVLLPFSPEVPELATNPYLLQFNPSSEMEAIHMTAYLSEKPSVRCVFVESVGTEIPTSISQLQYCITDQGLDVAYTTLSAILNDSLKFALSEEKDNVLLLNTERFANVRTLMPYLVQTYKAEQLTLLSRYSWQNEYMYIPQIYSTVFKDIDEVALETYNSLYEYYFPNPIKSSRPRYDLLGYDIMRYALVTVQAERDSSDVMDLVPAIEREYIGIQSDMHFVRVNEDGGYSNTQIKIVYKE